MLRIRLRSALPTPEAVVAGWMASPGHRANILSPNFTEIGVGLVSGAGKYYGLAGGGLLPVPALPPPGAGLLPPGAGALPPGAGAFG